MSFDTAHYTPADFFVLRTPLLPYNEWSTLGAGLRGAAAAEQELDEALAADRCLLRERLAALIASPAVREASPRGLAPAIPGTCRTANASFAAAVEGRIRC